MTQTMSTDRYLYSVERTDTNKWGWGHVTAVHVITASEHTPESEIRELAEHAATREDSRNQAEGWGIDPTIAAGIWHDPSTTVSGPTHTPGHGVGASVFVNRD